MIQYKDHKFYLTTFNFLLPSTPRELINATTRATSTCIQISKKRSWLDHHKPILKHTTRSLIWFIKITMYRRAFNHQEGGLSNSRHNSTPRLVAKKNDYRKLMGPILLTIIGLLIGLALYQNDNFKTQLHLLAEEANTESDGKIAALNEKLGGANDEINISSTKWEKRLNQATEKVQSLEHKLAKMDQKNKELEAKHESKSGNEVMLVSQLDHLRAEIQRHDKNAVLEKFGEGPHRVEFKLDFPPDEVPEGTSDSFIIEMASIDLVSLQHFSLCLFFHIVIIIID